ncbi:ribonuclease 3-like [Folsomia candida]|uniref:Ribonuclease 3 n=1 Tax=Folsomia candida TaxID=158441 RepID=A0A226CXU2_FOLCA|nr:ribonuclease 3-like [Folsomia candida]OXA37590.1 Ribonuclease 3 [Folsomia candida]
MGQGYSSELESSIGHSFQDKKLFEEATSHDFKRLEHLGDAVIKFVVTNYLFLTYPSHTEGHLSKERDYLVNRNRQQEIADLLQLDRFVKLHQSGVGRCDKLLEALIGAVYVDAGGEDGGGYVAAKKVIYKLWRFKGNEPVGHVRSYDSLVLLK